MAYEQKEGFGALFKNTKKEKETHPDYQGNVMIGGNVYDLGAWLKEGKNGKFLSLSAKVRAPVDKPPSTEPKANVPKTGSNVPKTGFEDFSDDVPFQP